MRNTTHTILAGIVMMVTGIYLNLLLMTFYYMTRQPLIWKGPPILATPGLTFIFPLGLAITLTGILNNQGLEVNGRRFVILYLLSFLLLILFIALWGHIFLF